MTGKLTLFQVQAVPYHPYGGQWFVPRPRSPPTAPRAVAADAHITVAAHTTDIFTLAATPSVLFSASGSSTINVHRINDASGTFPISQSLSAHKLGCHHVATAPRGSNGTVVASVGFGGDIKIWRSNPDSGDFSLDYEITPSEAKTKGVGDSWAVALSSDENYMACTTHDGKIHVWDLRSKSVVQTYETGGSGNGSFGLSVALSADGRLTASGHQNGSVYVFNNDAGHLKYSLSGKLLVVCVKT